MTQLTINIEDNSIVPHLKKILNAIEGVSIARHSKKKHLSGIEEAYQDIKEGRTTRFNNAEELFKSF